MTKPTVLILTAGENSRFFPFNTDTHKGNLELLGEPLIVRTLKDLEKHHFEQVVIVVSEKDYGGKGISGILPRYNFNLQIHFVLQPQAKGMGDAVLSAKEYLTGNFLVSFPYYFEVSEKFDEMKKIGTDTVICAMETDEPWNFGILEMVDGKAKSIVEKPMKGAEPSNLKNVVLHFLNQRFISILESMDEEQYSYEKALDTLMKQEDVGVYTLPGFSPTLKYPWHLFDFQRVLFSKAHSSTHPTAKIATTAIIDDSLGPVIIEADAVIGHAAKVMGPAYIGKGALVGDFSFVRGSSIEQFATVGANTEVVRSILFPYATIHFGYLADSIIGSESKIGAGLITANKRHDRESVFVRVKGDKVDSRIKALGVCVGSNTKIGVRTTTMPGVMIGADAIVYPSLTLFKNVEHGEIKK